VGFAASGFFEGKASSSQRKHKEKQKSQRENIYRMGSDNDLEKSIRASLGQSHIDPMKYLAVSTMEKG